MPDLSLDEIEAEIARREAMGETDETQMQPPAELQSQLAQQAQVQALNPAQEAVVDMDVMNKALMGNGKPSTKTSKANKEPANFYQYGDKQVDVSSYAPFASVTQANQANDVLRKSSIALKQINSINQKMKELKKLDKNNAISVANPYIGKYVNALRDVGSNLMGMDKKQMVLRKQLETEMARLRLNADTALKGAGPLGEKMYARFEDMNIHPNLINEGFPVTEAKLKDLEKELKGLKVGAEMGLKTNRSIPYDDVELLISAEEDEKQANKAVKKEVSAAIPEDRKKQLLEMYNSDPDNEPFLSLPDEVKLKIMAEAGDI
jgi:hypothetical protein